MRHLTETLAKYTSTAGHLGQETAEEAKRGQIQDRAQLLSELQRDIDDTRGILIFWIALNALVFSVLLGAAISRLAEPYVTVPFGCTSLFLLMRRVEAVWREMRVQNLARSMALSCHDEHLLREMMTTMNAALLLDARSRNLQGQPRVEATEPGNSKSTEQAPAIRG